MMEALARGGLTGRLVGLFVSGENLPHSHNFGKRGRSPTLRSKRGLTAALRGSRLPG